MTRYLTTKPMESGKSKANTLICGFRIKRLVRRTLCFSKTEQMHDLVIGLFINRYEFGLSL